MEQTTATTQLEDATDYRRVSLVDFAGAGTSCKVRITHGRAWYANKVGEVLTVRRELYRRKGKSDAPMRAYLTVLDDGGAATERAIHPADTVPAK